MPSKSSMRHEGGQSLVEFGLSMFVLLLLLSGVVDMGRAFFSYMALRDAAQEGAIYGSTYPSDFSGIEQRARATSRFPVDLGDTSVITSTSGVTTTTVAVVTTVDSNPAARCAGAPIEVKVTYQFPITMPFLGVIVGAQSFPLSASVTDTILRPPCY